MPKTEIAEGHLLTEANEDYLEAILRVEEEHGSAPDEGIRSVDVAEKLGVSKASVNKALSLLKEMGLIEQARYGRVLLTAEGRAYAEEVWRTHRTIRQFLHAELGVPFERADEEACTMEHALSKDTMARWMAHLEAQGIGIE